MSPSGVVCAVSLSIEQTGLRGVIVWRARIAVRLWRQELSAVDFTDVRLASTILLEKSMFRTTIALAALLLAAQLSACGQPPAESAVDANEERTPNCINWHQRMMERPAVKATFAMARNPLPR